MFFIYILMGSLFAYMAFEKAAETVWNPLTIILALIAAIDFFVAFKLLGKSFKKKTKES